MRENTQVRWMDDDGDIRAQVGVVFACPALDLDGNDLPGTAEVRWAEDDVEVCDLFHLIPVTALTPELLASRAGF